MHEVDIIFQNYSFLKYGTPMDAAENRGYFDIMNVILEYFTYNMVNDIAIDINVPLGLFG